MITADIENIDLVNKTQPAENRVNVLARNRSSAVSPYLTTEEAAQYMRKSESWLIKQADLPFLKSAPNLYSKKDLDDWFERHKFHPRLN